MVIMAYIYIFIYMYMYTQLYTCILFFEGKPSTQIGNYPRYGRVASVPSGLAAS